MDKKLLPENRVRALQFLMLEDEPADAELAERELRKAGIVFSSRRVDTRDTFVAALAELPPDLILADYRLPAFDGLAALGIAREKTPEVPFIFLSGAMGEEFAIETLHQGAADYVLKGHLSKLVPAVNRALLDAEEQRRRKTAEIALAESEERFRNMAESAQDSIVIVDADGLITYWNAAATRMFGYGRDEALGQDIHQLLAPVRYREAASKGWAEFRQKGSGKVVDATVEMYALHKDGREFPAELSISAAPIKQSWNAVGIIRDISERKRAEQSLRRSNRFLRTLSRCNETLVHAHDEIALLQDMCRVIVELGEFALAWVGYVEDGGSIRPMAQFGERAAEFVGDLSIDCMDADGTQSLTCEAVRSGQTQVVQNIAASGTAPWQKQALEYGYRSRVVLPLRTAQTVIGALNIYAAEVEGFGEEELGLLTELADDLGFGTMTLRMRTEREENARRLEQALEDTITAIATTIEARDPYTAGHQKRVAQLAGAIAREIGLPEHRITGVLRGAEIHDIGKIYIPAEILSRPGRLTAPEFGIIKVHSQVGYDIVKGIEFPWPIATMILQHHERLDGSGYPNGLAAGDELILEARILAVADVVDAMVSHRPYRAALGLEAALAEVVKHRGILYDTAVADACVRLFREKGFVFG